MNELPLSDLELIRQTSPEMAELILEVCKLNVSEMHKAIFSEKNKNGELAKSLDKAKLSEMIEFYNSMQTIFIDYEMYEYCAKLLDCLEYLENFSGEIVGAN